VRIKENLEFYLGAQIQGQPVTVGEINEDILDGFDGGLLTIGQQTISFIVSKDDKNFFIVAAGPFDVSLTSEGRAEAIEEAKRQAIQLAKERSDELNEMVRDLPRRGASTAPVTVVEFSDFQCPFCKGTSEIVEQILEKYPDEVKFSYLHFPLNIHPWAMPAAINAACTAEMDSGAFWVLHDAYFKNQDDITPENVLEKSRGFLAGSGLDMSAWSDCAENTQSAAHLAAVAAVQQSMATGNAYGLTGTPGFFINGTFIRGAPPIDQFVAVIEEALAR